MVKAMTRAVKAKDMDASSKRGVKKAALKEKLACAKSSSLSSSLIDAKVGRPLPVGLWPKTIDLDRAPRVYWLPSDWGQGLKNTCRTCRRAWVSPEGKLYYHRVDIEKAVGRKLGPGDGLEGAISWAKERMSEGKNWQGLQVTLNTEKKLFSLLSKSERSHLPEADEILFCVVSARRAGKRESMRALVNIQAQLVSAGVTPRWYVDEPSLKDYKALGLDAVVGGKLTPARNKALADAKRMGKACVQLSDDISGFDFYNGDMAKAKGLDLGNQAAKNAEHFKVSPVAAARFLLAKMRGAPWEPKPRLGGGFPLGNTGQAFCQESVHKHHFILGDFFVDDRSGLKFDTSMTLKEDYDFTCSHLHKFGSVLRCNRLFAHAVHETNAGGACSVRDTAGERERENIRILQSKWPGVFRTNPVRGDTQVILSWKTRQF